MHNIAQSLYKEIYPISLTLKSGESAPSPFCSCKTVQTSNFKLETIFVQSYSYTDLLKWHNNIVWGKITLECPLLICLTLRSALSGFTQLQICEAWVRSHSFQLSAGLCKTNYLWISSASLLDTKCIERYPWQISALVCCSNIVAAVTVAAW